MLGDGSIDDMDDKTRFATELVLLGVLAADEHLDGVRLDEFMGSGPCPRWDLGELRLRENGILDGGDR